MDGLRADFAAVQPVPFGAMLGPRDPAAGTKARGEGQGRRAFLSRIHKRRFASLKAAEEAAAVLPEEGQAVHCIMTGLYDLMHLLIVLLDRFRCPCACMRVGTLSLSRRNVQEMVALYDQGKVARLELLCSDFFRKHDDEIFAELVQEFHQRGQRVAAARSHCKVVTLALDDGRRYVLEGSANLRTNRNLEQFALTRDPALHGWYDRWLEDMITAHEVPGHDVQAQAREEAGQGNASRCPATG